MAASAKVAYLARRAQDYGVGVGEVSVRLSEVLARKDKVVTSFREGSLRGIEKTENLDLIRGEARFTGRSTLEVDNPEGERLMLSGEQIFINTGTRPAVPPLPGLDEIPYLDSTSILDLEELPRHLLVLGGGYIGIEFGQMFRRFGSRVSLLQRSRQLLPQEDWDVAEEVAKILREDGLDIILEAEASSLKKQEGGGFVLSARTPAGTRELTASHLLVATGRRPNTDRLHLEAAGISQDDKGFVPVNDRLETNVPGIYALGDVKGGPAFTHISYDDFRILKGNLLEERSLRLGDRPVPYTVFMDPQLGRVGLSEREARERKLDYRTAKLPMSRVARAIEFGETRGFMKALVDAQSDRILGCAVLGMEGGEVMAVLQVAMMGGLPYTAIRDGIFAHPTLAESLNNLFMTLPD